MPTFETDKHAETFPVITPYKRFEMNKILETEVDLMCYSWVHQAAFYKTSVKSVQYSFALLQMIYIISQSGIIGKTVCRKRIHHMTTINSLLIVV